jgi:hypothetical protein
MHRTLRLHESLTEPFIKALSDSAKTCPQRLGSSFFSKGQNERPCLLRRYSAAHLALGSLSVLAIATAWRIQCLLAQGDAKSIPMVWRASAAVRRGALTRQGLGVMSLATKVSGLIKSVLAQA